VSHRGHLADAQPILARPAWQCAPGSDAR
jgi:hypothetical protein